MRVCTHVCLCVHACAHMHVHVRACLCMCVHTCVCSHACAWVSVYVCVHVCACTHVCEPIGSLLCSNSLQSQSATQSKSSLVWSGRRDRWLGKERNGFRGRGPDGLRGCLCLHPVSASPDTGNVCPSVAKGTSQVRSFWVIQVGSVGSQGPLWETGRRVRARNGNSKTLPAGVQDGP